MNGYPNKPKKIEFLKTLTSPLDPKSKDLSNSKKK